MVIFIRNMPWYEVGVYRAHRNSSDAITKAYILAKDVTGVLRRYHIMPGVKRDIHKYFPSIRELSLHEASALEDRIRGERIISLTKAKKSWYYDDII